MKILVIGGGIFGSTIATELSDYGCSVTLVESHKDIMEGASQINHNRIHFGYHYPRSLNTARQCLDSIPAFFLNYGDAIISNFPNYYAISKDHSFITVNEFVDFCKEARLDLHEKYPKGYYLNRENLSASFIVNEPIFDGLKVKNIVKDRLCKSGVNVLCNTHLSGADGHGLGGGYTVRLNDKVFNFDWVVNATYSGLNVINKLFNLCSMELRFEETVMPVFKFDSPKIGLTVMDGPFCTVMPYGNLDNNFLLWHVDGSVLSNSTNIDSIIYNKDSSEDIANRLFKMSSSFMPFLSNVEFCGLKKIIKTVYENKYDSRVSEIYLHEDSPNFISILSGKIMCAPQISYQVREYIMNGGPLRSVLV